MAELLWRLRELASLLSCLLNVLIGTGDREITLSAGSWELRRRGSRWGCILVAAIDTAHGALGGDADHCLNAWTEHAPLWIKVLAEHG